MGALCELFAVGASGRIGVTSSRDALVDAAFEFAGAAGIPMSPTANRAFTAMFDATIGNFLDKHGPEQWAGRVRTSALKRIRQVGEEAKRIAVEAGELQISAAALTAATEIVVNHGRSVEARLTAATA